MKAHLALLLSIILLALSGCGVAHPVLNPTKHPFQNVTNVINHASHTLDWFFVLGGLIVAAAIALFFFLPAAQPRLTVSLAAGGVSLMVLSVLMNIVLPFLPWVAWGFVAITLLIGVYEIYMKRKTGSFVDPANIVTIGETTPTKG